MDVLLRASSGAVDELPLPVRSLRAVHELRLPGAAGLGAAGLGGAHGRPLEGLLRPLAPLLLHHGGVLPAVVGGAEETDGPDDEAGQAQQEADAFEVKPGERDEAQVVNDVAEGHLQEHTRPVNQVHVALRQLPACSLHGRQQRCYDQGDRGAPAKPHEGHWVNHHQLSEQHGRWVLHDHRHRAAGLLQPGLALLQHELLVGRLHPH
mmetsp:Transcript_55515/g.162221  ORF Transcript_55515/g.162221 Transcript_55515/m.162221 type:complete len:207 (-) Transcript_55515:1447-2067(-)